jgi:tRNA1Val (adenine37-N6)-methyltransferase
MANDWFQFKQFLIKQDKTAMKVGTDGVLLGSWANLPEKGRVLDVGVGTGLLSLMIAQRNSELCIDGVEIERNAYVQARENVDSSKWADRIHFYNASFKDFAAFTTEYYDLIVCNPPFYRTKNPGQNTQRAIARHADSLDLYDIFSFSIKILSENGIICLILPAEQLDVSLEIAQSENLHLQRLTYLKPTPQKDPHRVLLQYGKMKIELEKTTIIIEEFGRHKYSDEFIQLLRPFYLNL